MICLRKVHKLCKTIETKVFAVVFRYALIYFQKLSEYFDWIRVLDSASHIQAPNNDKENVLFSRLFRKYHWFSIILNFIKRFA